MAGSRLSEARRCFSVLALILLLITLFGSHLPWMQISEEGHEHKWTITEDATTSSDVIFYMDMYFNLLSIEACQTFVGDTNFFFDGQVSCSVMPFSDAHKNTVDIHDWSMYSDSCESAGLTAFVMIITSVSILILVVLISTFKNIQRKCCPKMYQSQHERAKCLVPTCAVFAPICGIVSILIYFVQCINNAAGKDVVTANTTNDVQRSVMGYQGFWIAMAGTICLVFWWILFTIWFCGKTVEAVDFAGGGGDAGAESERTTRQKQPIAQDSDDDDDDDDSQEDNSRIELAKHQT